MFIADLKKVQKIIGGLEKKYLDGNFIFRGATKEYSKMYPEGDGINSTLYRWAVKKLGGRHVFDEENFRLAHLEKAILEKVEKILSQNMDNRRILTSIQHYGGKTSLIDFTRSLPIALFFACNDHMGENQMGKNDDGENGELIVMREDILHKNKEILYPGPYNSGGLLKIRDPYPQGYVELVEPAKTDDNKLRVLFQNSVFVRPASGYLEKDEDAKGGNIAKGKYAVEIIEIKDKKAILSYLDEYHGIKSETIYNDLVGFIANPNSYESFDFCMQMGKSLNKTHQHKQALSYYGKASRYPNSPVQKSLVALALGKTCSTLGGHQIAEALFAIAVEDNPNCYKAYFERGKTRIVLKEYPAAFDDFRVALELAKKRSALSNEIEEISLSLDRAEKLMESTDSDDGD